MADLPYQRWDPRQYADNARFVTNLGAPVVELLAPRPGERVLDLGCGDGPLTAALAGMGCDVVGVDASPDMVAAARALGLDARVMSGEALSFADEFDAVFSNAALHWMKDGAAVVAGVARALRPGGRFVGEFGGEGNIAAIVGALNAERGRRGLPALDPWFNPGPAEYKAMLEARGLRVDFIRLFPRPTPLPGSIRDWLANFAGAFLAGIPDGEEGSYLDAVTDALRPRLLGADGVWTVDYVRLRFAAVRA
jgi:trans-aconitate methyltransferase